MLTEWFIRAAVDQWPDHFHGRHLMSIRRGVSTLQSCGYMKKEDLALFLGKWKEKYTKEKYGPTVEVDWAVQRISE